MDIFKKCDFDRSEKLIAETPVSAAEHLALYTIYEFLRLQADARCPKRANAAVADRTLTLDDIRYTIYDMR